MAEYGVKYRFRWNDEGGGDWRIDICQAGYTGDILPRAIGASSVSLRRDRNGNICGTSLELTAECRVDEEFAELYTTDPFEFKVLVYAESVCIWTGYVTPELYSEPFIAPPYDVKVTASDNLGELKLTEWVGVGRLTFAQLLNTLLAQTGLSMGVKYISTLATGSISARAFFSTVTIDLDELSGKSYYDVLDQLLASFHAVLFQHGGSWVVLRETDVVPSISGGAVVPAGQSAGMPIRSLGSAYAGGLWPENHVDLTVEPAKKAISLVCPELWNRCGTASITNPSTGNATGTLTATFAAADGINLQDSAALSRYPLVLNIEALRKNRSNKVYYDIVVKVQGNGVTRYLVENTDAAAGYVWQSSSASIKITPGDKLYYAGRGDVSASKSGEVTSIPFPDCNDITALTKIEVTLTSNTIATSYRPTRYLPSVYFFGVWISYDDQFTSLMDTIAINNNARGAASDVNLIVSGLTDVALEKYFISNSLLDGSGSLLGAVHTSAFEGQDYISLLSRDYALSIAAPRLKAEGVFYGQERTDLPLFMSMGGLRYVIETWDWNLITGGVDFSALTLPAATITVTSETIVTGDNLGHGTSSGSGGSGGSSSSGAGYVAPGTGVPALTEAYIGTTRVQPSPTEDQDLTGIGNATLSGKLNLPQGAYLEVVNVGTTANPVYAIHTNIGLYSDSFVSAFGASDTGGGGGGGIDLAAMWANLQVNESGTTGYNLQINPGHLTTALGTYVNAITTTGSGNAITAVSKDGSTLTFTKGSTFALASRTVTGTGYLTGGGALSANRTIDIASTYKGYIDEGHTAYGWGDHSQAGYLTGITSSMVTTALGFTPANSTALENYLPLTGGTMSGNIVFAKSGSTTVGYPILALSSITGGWSRKLYELRYDDTRMFHIGVFGSSSTFNYAYLGSNGYNGNNLRIYSDKVQFGDNVIWHAGNDGASSGLDADLLDGQHGSYYATASSLENYLPLAGGTMTGSIIFDGGVPRIKFDVDTSRARGIAWLNTSDTTVGQILMHNTAKSIYINATGASEIYNDAVGKYSLKIGQDKLTYNTYSIYHTNNLTKSVVTGLIGSTTYAPYNADGYLPLSGGTMTGSPVLSNAVYLRANNAAGTEWTIMGLNSSDNLLIGYGTAGQGYETHLYGGSIEFHYGTGRATGMVLTSDGDVTLANTLCLNNNKTIRWKDTNGNLLQCLQFNSVNRFHVGYGAAVAGYDTYINGNNIYFRYGTTPTNGAIITSDGNVGIGTDSPAYKLDVAGVIHASSNVTAGGNITATGYISSASYVNSLGLKFPTNANRTSINATGWYRVWTGGARDTFPTSIILNITKNYGGSASEGYLIEIGLAGNGQVTFNQISGTTQTTTRNITKIRYVYVYNTAAPSTYIDIYYSGSAQNNVQVSGLSGHGTFSAPTAVSNTTGYSTIEFETMRFAQKTSRNIVAMGYISAFGVSSTSDARLKKDFLDTTLTVDDIAHAPAITFLWKDREGRRQAGSLAQYWETVLPEVVTDIEGKKGLDYGAAALVSAITIARDVNDHEKRIRELERENRELKRRLGYAME